MHKFEVILFQILICVVILCHQALGFWDIGTTTDGIPYEDNYPRTSFFRWQWCVFPKGDFWWLEFQNEDKTHRLNCFAGTSIDNKPISTAIILTRRTLISPYNPYAGYMNRQKDIRIWALGLGAKYNTPFRYRAYRITRLFPESGNPEHCHGPRCIHKPRHDVAVIVTLDQLFLLMDPKSHFAVQTVLTSKTQTLDQEIWFGGSGYQTLTHIRENYKIKYSLLSIEDVVDCSMYLPKWWGKFICVRNTYGFAGLQNGGGFFTGATLVGIGCFEIRVNDDRIFVFTDLRYYITYIEHYANITPGQYYEYAYPQWGVEQPYYWGLKIPQTQIMNDLYPLGK